MKLNSKKIAEKVKHLGDGAKQILDDASKKLNKDGMSATAAELGGKAKCQIRDITEQLKKHDFKNEVGGFFAEAKQDPSTIWKKPGTLRPGRELAIVGFAASVVAFLLALVTTSAIMGVICLVLGVSALLLSLLGLRTEGRKFAFGGVGFAFLVVICSLCQVFSSGKGGGSRRGNGGKYPLLIVEEGEESSVDSIFDMAKKANRNGSLNFYGFYPGMSMKNARKLRDHYGLDEKHVNISFNMENGEVSRVFFTPKAVVMIMGVVNNLDAAEEAIQNYLGIPSWNNQKAVDKAEELNDDIQEYGNDSDKTWGKVFALDNTARVYNTADGVYAKLYPKNWKEGKGALEIVDPKRKAASAEFNARFYNNNRMRKEWAELKNNATNKVEVKMLELPNGWEYLLKKAGDSWVSAFEVSAYLYKSVFKKTDKDIINMNTGKKWLEICDNFNSLSTEVKGDLVFRLPWREEAKLIPNDIRNSMKEKHRNLSISGTLLSIYMGEANGIPNNFLIAETPDVAEKHFGRLSEAEVQVALSDKSESFKTFTFEEWKRQMEEYRDYKDKHNLTDGDMQARGRTQPSMNGIKADAMYDKGLQKSYLKSIGVVVEEGPDGTKYYWASKRQQKGTATAKGEPANTAAGAEQKPSLSR